MKRLDPDYINGACLVNRVKDVIAAQPTATGAYIGLAGLYPPDSDDQLAVLVQAHTSNPGDPQLGLALGSAQEKRRRPAYRTP